MLGGYRILDLSDEKGLLGGKILGDLGAEVLKIEKPGGDDARNIGPFCQDAPGSGTSLFWLAYNSNKKGITLNLQTRDGTEVFRQLVEKSSAIIECFPPGRMDELGIGYSQLKKAKPSLVMTSITPYGQDGPYAKHRGSDIACVASSGYMYLTGDTDRAPVRVSFPFSYVQAGANAALGTLMALHGATRTGTGQHVDVSIQESMAPQIVNAVPYWVLRQTVLRRSGQLRSGVGSGITPHQTWRCKDGWLHFALRGGPSHVKTNASLARWMEDEGRSDEFLKSIDWATLDMAGINQDFVERMEGPVRDFFAGHTKDELFAGGLKRRIDLYPVNTPKDLADDVQLQSRDFWTDVRQSPDKELRYPGRFIESSSVAIGIRRPAPTVGEHNWEVYGALLGISDADLAILRGRNVI